MKGIVLLLTAAAVLSGCKCDQAAQQEQPRVRNVIYMIGDGMGVAQVTALMLSNDMQPVNFERAEATGLVKTYSANNRVTDSAAAGTALASGHKTNNGWLGVTPDAKPVTSILTKAEEDGYATGIVVTCIVPHATPGAFYGHVTNRGEYDSIAMQFVESDIDVLMGGGRKYFNARSDGRDLMQELRDKDYLVTETLAEASGATEGKLVVLANDNDLPYYQDGRGDYLPEAVTKTLEILKNNSVADKGFFLMVEGSMIDYAGHGNDADRVKSEVRDFDKAIGVAFDFADANPGTLVVVLADHETGGLTIPSGSSDFTAAESGIDYNFGTAGHTGSMIPMFAYGTGAGNFSGVFDNTDIPKIIEKLQLAE